LAVGPEGGWVDFEIDKFIEQSFVPISMGGERVLRTDTAVVALLSQLMLLQG
jgi:RsmE family RNA methyltransferase